jgi:hypothetical protein
MKNIHILSTDKPSRLYLTTHEYIFKKGYALSTDECENKNIYITSDEEIKEGDYGLGFALGIKEVGRGHYVFKQDGTNVGKLNAICNGSKKIILTTDPQLIADGVQAIDDEFLEWFVKNPSCESVEVENERVVLDDVNYNFDVVEYKYKIIIPKEEPKQEPGREIADYIDRHIVEALVEVGKQKMYSEEEVLVKLYECLGHFAYQHNIVINGNEIDKWFKQFKKK